MNVRIVVGTALALVACSPEESQVICPAGSACDESRDAGNDLGPVDVPVAMADARADVGLEPIDRRGQIVSAVVDDFKRRPQASKVRSLI